MSFLTPLFLLGGLTLGLPVLFHLIRRSSKDQLPFSSLLFLQPTPPRVTRRNRLEHLLLLLLRGLVLLLLALAFARPFLPRGRLAPPTTPPRTRLLLLLDTSASMRRLGLWPTAVAKAEEVVRGVGPADQVALFTFDRLPHPLLSFNDGSALAPAARGQLVAQRLAQPTPGWAGTDLGTALTSAAELLAGKDTPKAATFQRRLVVISDLQEGSRLDGLQGYDWPRGVRIEFIRVHPLRPTNAGLQWAPDLETALPAGADARPRLRISNSPDAQHEQFRLQWEGAEAGDGLDVYVPPGQSRLVLAPKPPPGLSPESLILTGDDEPFDNRLYVLPPKPAELTVVYLGPESPADPAQPLYYLLRAFPPTRRQIVRVVTVPPTGTLAPATLAAARLVVVTAPAPEVPEAAVQSFLAKGGTVLLALQKGAATASLGRWLGLETLQATDVTPASYAMLAQIAFDHPLFAPFADPRYSDFTKIHFWKYRRLATNQLAEARVLARFDTGDAALTEVARGRGQILILAAGWQPAESQLALSSKFVPLLYAMLERGGGAEPPPQQYHVGDTVDLTPLLRAVAASQATVRMPDGRPVSLATVATTFTATDLPGIYTITSTQPPRRFVVNLDPAESRTAALPSDQLERLGLPLKPREVAVARRLAQERRQQDAELENRQKLWRWLIGMALVMVLAETSLAGWLTHRTTGPTEPAV